MQAKDKVIVLTGAGSGIGQELAIQLLRKGARVAGIDIHSDALAQTQALAGVGDDQFKAFVLDISDKQKVDALPAEVIQHFGTVDGLINNAGIIQKFIPINDLNIEDIQRVINVNFYGTVYLTKAFLPLLLERPAAHIVNVSSMGGFIPFPGQTVYGAAKAAVKLFTEGLYAELKATPVRVTVVHPGAIATNIVENSGLGKPSISSAQANRALPAAKAAELIIKAMERDQFRVMVGKDASFMDLFYRLNPQRAVDFIQRKMADVMR
ncbi:SDR family NAD(P)-dependent oxidoreductase [Haliscomenobacter sp.]|uniref:SDR family NAD(P)-dependent oxidoreductase n=1 Tax=Haliscomenobacter sp. TaxID=2717303 RepID=UPI003BAC685B